MWPTGRQGAGVQGAGARNRAGGFTLIEMMIAIAILGFLLVGVVQMFGTARQTLGVVSTYSEFLSNARLALAPMARDLRMAGFDPMGTSRFGFKTWEPTPAQSAAGAVSFTSVATAGQILFGLDANRNSLLDNTPTERVGFMLDGTNLVRTQDAVIPGAVIARNVTGLAFVYLNGGGDALSAADTASEPGRNTIRQVQVTVTFQETASDVTRTHVVTTDIKLRNI